MAEENGGTSSTGNEESDAAAALTFSSVRKGGACAVSGVESAWRSAPASKLPALGLEHATTPDPSAKQAVESAARTPR
jgi:hypothetical protein